jgi:hypothetical protein
MQNSGNNIRGLTPNSRRKKKVRGFALIGIVSPKLGPQIISYILI